ncbi:hypothetical protein J3E68DRAFT_392323 [Trichoderma sp. SZMC 28012]
MPRTLPTLHTFISSFLRAMPIVSGRNCGAPNLSVDLVGGLQLSSQSKAKMPGDGFVGIVLLLRSFGVGDDQKTARGVSSSLP